MRTRITVIGGGAMATACSVLLADHADQDVRLWMRNADYAADVRRTRENRRLLPGVALPESIVVTSDIDEAVDGAELLFIVIPTKFLREALTGLKPHLPVGIPVVSAIKGMEVGTFMRPSQMIREILGPCPVVALGGPSHAEEIARRLPASVVAASEDIELARRVQAVFSTDRFRVYAHSDLLGVELAGALKNVIAIAAGISDGLGYGDNAKSALMTRGLVEMTRFGCAQGADPATFTGLAGMGDLITTCNSNFSRNRSVGLQLGRGRKLPEILAGMAAVAEGVTATRSVHEQAMRDGLDLPITAEVYGVLFDDHSPEEATDRLMMRPPRDETES